MEFISSLALEQLALDQLFDERAYAEIPRLGPREDRLDLGAVREADRRAGGEHRQLLHEVSSQGRLVLQEQLLELPHVFERSSVGQLAGRIYRQAPVELQPLAVHPVALDRRHAVGDGAVPIAE